MKFSLKIVFCVITLFLNSDIEATQFPDISGQYTLTNFGTGKVLAEANIVADGNQKWQCFVDYGHWVQLYVICPDEITGERNKIYWYKYQGYLPAFDQGTLNGVDPSNALIQNYKGLKAPIVWRKNSS